MTDTGLTNTVANYTAILLSQGFEQVLNLPFTAKNIFTGKDQQEVFFVYAHRDGLLLAFDTYLTTNVNAANVYYNLKKTGVDASYSPSDSSGGIEDGAWVGKQDARERLVGKLNTLRRDGTFMKTWPKGQWLWLLHHGDTDAKRYEHHNAITSSRVAMLPDWVREMINR